MSYDASFFPSVVSLLNMEGLADGTNFPDMNSARVWTRSGSGLVTKQSQKKYGGASGYFPGNVYLSTPAASDFDFSTGAFTIEAWVYIAANSAVDGGGIRDAVLCSTMSASAGGFAFGVLGDGSTTGTGLWWEDKNGSNISGSWTTTVSQNAWHHLCVSRASGGSDLYLGLDGTLQTSAITGGGSRVLGASAYPMWIGAQNVTSWNRYLNGYIDDFRITKGVARYTGASYTAPPEPLPGYKQNAGTRVNRIDTFTCKSQNMQGPIAATRTLVGRRTAAPSSIAVDFGTLSGTITESLAYAKWRLQFTDAVTGEHLGSRLIAGSAYSVLVANNRPFFVSCAPVIDRMWAATQNVGLNELWVPKNAASTPYSYVCTTAGRTGGTEPSWGTSIGGTTNDGTVTWTCLARLPQPQIQGPLVVT